MRVDSSRFRISTLCWRPVVLSAALLFRLLQHAAHRRLFIFSFKFRPLFSASQPLKGWGFFLLLSGFSPPLSRPQRVKSTHRMQPEDANKKKTKHGADGWHGETTPRSDEYLAAQTLYRPCGHPCSDLAFCVLMRRWKRGALSNEWREREGEADPSEMEEWGSCVSLKRKRLCLVFGGAGGGGWWVLKLRQHQDMTRTYKQEERVWEEGGNSQKMIKDYCFLSSNYN